MKKGIGLVLSGGGARGAYEIGVMKALEELNLTKRITGISGSSVGALNTALFTIRDTIRIIDIWENVKQSDFTNIDLTKTLEDISRSLLIGMPINLLSIPYPFVISLHTANKLKIINTVKPIINFNNLLSWIYNGIFSKRGLEGIIDRNNILGDELYKKYEIFSTVYNGKTEYVSWINKSPEEVKQIMLASASIPIIYSPKTKINRIKLYYDGGIGDNTPIKPLYDIGYRDFIVVYLKKEEKVKDIIMKKATAFPDAIFHNIIPDFCFDDKLIHTLTINKERVSNYINSGYFDALPVLLKIKTTNYGYDLHR